MALWFRHFLDLGSCICLVSEKRSLYGIIIDTGKFTSAPLLSNILPHIQKMINFITNTLPKPVLFALAYRLTVLHLASFILPTIGADSWEMEYGVDDGWNARPVRPIYEFVLWRMNRL